MKLIEKKANDYYQERPQGFGTPTEDFMAGFRAARELAALEWDKRAMNELAGPHADTEAALQSRKHFAQNSRQNADQLRRMGEEEI